MLKSMTGFGASDAEDENYKFHLEIKSVNQRFLDLDFHMPHLFGAWENKMRAVIKKHVVRGKLDIYITLTDKGESQPCINVNKALAKAYQEALGLSGGTIADIDGAFEYNSSKVMISYSETSSLANFIMIYK